MRGKRAIGYLITGILFTLLFARCGGGGGGGGAASTTSGTVGGASPVVSTVAATSITENSALLNATVIPNGSPTTYWFEYGTDPSFAVYGSTVGQSAGSGVGTVPVSFTLNGLSPGVTYYYRIYALNDAGGSRGSGAHFMTSYPDTPPATITLAATGVTTTEATVNATVTANGLATNAWFEWGQDVNLATFSTTPSMGIGSSTTSQSFNRTLTGLTPGVAYYYRVAASNIAGETKGGIASVTPGGAPSVVTLSATSVLSSSADLNANVTPNGTATDAWFEWGTSSSLSSYSVTSTQSIGSGTAAQPVVASLSSLSVGATYYFRIAAVNATGTAKGTIVSFTPTSAPSAATLPATAVGGTSGVLQGSAVANGLNTYAWFELGLASDLTGGDNTVQVYVGHDNVAQSVSYAATLLTPGTTYYYRLVASNAAGTVYGDIASFTPGAAPAVSTLTASSISATAATINGNANPHGLDTQAWFEWGTNSDLAGSSSTTPASVGSGTAVQTFSFPLTGLSGGTYYFRAVASNATGTTRGGIVPFVAADPVPVETKFMDDFGTDTTERASDLTPPDPHIIDYYLTTGGYTVGVYGSYAIDPAFIVPGIGEGFVYDAANQRGKAHMSVNHGVTVYRNLPALTEGVFSVDFWAAQKYGDGAAFLLRLKQDGSHYYEITNGVNDGWGAVPHIRKVVGGVAIDTKEYTNYYAQSGGSGEPYLIKVTFSPAQVTWEAFGYTYTYFDPSANAIAVSAVEMDFWQQDAYIDNVLLQGAP